MKSSRIDALIFDLDGTLADSVADIGGAANDLLAEYRLPPLPVESYKTMVGEGAELLLRRAFRAAQGDDPLPADIRVLLEGYRQAYQRLGHRGSVPYPGVDAMLDGVALARRPMAVLSNKRDEFTRGLVERAFGRWSFVEVRGERDGVPKKPDPTAALELAGALGVPPERVGFVGDTAIDMRTATAAGMVPIGALWGFRSKEELLGAGARYLIARPEELIGLIT